MVIIYSTVIFYLNPLFAIMIDLMHHVKILLEFLKKSDVFNMP